MAILVYFPALAIFRGNESPGAIVVGARKGESMKEHKATAPLSGGNLETVLKMGQFALTAETAPPVSADPEAVRARTGGLKGLADAVNVLDGPGAQTHLSPLASAAIMARAGIEPVLQFTMRAPSSTFSNGYLKHTSENVLCCYTRENHVCVF